MTRSRFAILAGVALACLAFPAAARAQSAIAGVVKDASGAVLPGVTVEAASPALIEKVRSVTTDAQRRVQNREPPAWHLHADVHPPRFFDGQARRRRAAVELHGDASTPT